MECDGGHFTFRFDERGPMLIEFGETDSIVIEGDCGEDTDTPLRYLGDATDDKLFRLDPVDLANCIPTIRDRHLQWRAQAE